MPKKQENMTKPKSKIWTVGTDSRKIYILELTEKNFKIIIINTFQKIE